MVVFPQSLFRVMIIKRGRLMRRRLDPGETLNCILCFPNFHDVNIVFTFHYLKCISSMYVHCIFYFTFLVCMCTVYFILHF